MKDNEIIEEFEDRFTADFMHCCERKSHLTQAIVFILGHLRKALSEQKYEIQRKLCKDCAEIIREDQIVTPL